MDEVIALLKRHVNPATGELILNAEQTHALFRWMAGRAFVEREMDNCAHRILEFGERFIKSMGGNDVLKNLTDAVDAIERRPR